MIELIFSLIIYPGQINGNFAPHQKITGQKYNF